MCAQLVGHPALWMPPNAPCASQDTMLKTPTALPACPAPRALTATPGDPVSAHIALLALTLLVK